MFDTCSNAPFRHNRNRYKVANAKFGAAPPSGDKALDAAVARLAKPAA